MKRGSGFRAIALFYVFDVSMSLDDCHILDLGILCAVCCLGFLLWGVCSADCVLLLPEHILSPEHRSCPGLSLHAGDIYWRLTRCFMLARMVLMSEIYGNKGAVFIELRGGYRSGSRHKKEQASFTRCLSELRIKFISTNLTYKFIQLYIFYLYFSFLSLPVLSTIESAWRLSTI